MTSVRPRVQDSGGEAAKGSLRAALRRRLTSATPDAVLRGGRAVRAACVFATTQYLQPWLLSPRVRHLAGPARIPYGEDEVLAICVVRNGAGHLRSFVDHHLRLGVCHIVLLDNGSTDDTVAIARELKHVTVLQTDAPYQKYENVMKRYLARRFSRGRWNLCVDIDERFDYPCSDRVSLPSLLRYLRVHGYSALVTQMLDLFPDCTLAELEHAGAERLEEVHAYYDLSNVRKTAYRYGVASNPDIRMHWDGIRNTLFGTSNGLTKAALVRVEPGTGLFVKWHHVQNARIADLSGVLLHYPFAGAFHAKVENAVETGRYGRLTTGEYERYWNGLSTRPRLSIRQPTSQRWTEVDALVRDGFLVVSPAYRSWAAVGGGERSESGSPSASTAHG